MQAVWGFSRMTKLYLDKSSWQTSFQKEGCRWANLSRYVEGHINLGGVEVSWIGWLLTLPFPCLDGEAKNKNKNDCDIIAELKANTLNTGT